MRIAIVLLAIASLASAETFSSYLVGAQWDGRTVPNVEWALRLSTQTTSWTWNNVNQLQTLIPTTPGDALSPTLSAYDPISRAFFIAVGFRADTGLLFSSVIAKDCNSSSTPVQTSFKYPYGGAVMVGLEVWTNPQTNAMNLYLIYQDGTVVTINPNTGATAPYLALADATHEATAAITLDQATNRLFVITQNVLGTPIRVIQTVNLVDKSVAAVNVGTLPDHDPLSETPFEMAYLPQMKHLIVFETGNFDDIYYADPITGNATWAIPNLAEYGGADGGKFEFTQDPFLEDDDLWSDAVVDNVQNKLYFQCTDVDPNSGEETTALCQIPVLSSPQPLYYVNSAIEPMIYGWAGLQMVQVVH